MKYVSRVFAATVSALMVIIVGVGAVSAATYDVSASVPFPVPTQAATINSALNNITVQNAAFVISGTCQVLAPASVISVWRGSTVLGSQNCASGTYSLQITLAEGPNSLVVKTANVSSVYGPDSSSIIVTLKTLVTPPPPTTPKVNVPGATNLTPADNTAFNNAASSGLSIVPQDPFTVVPPSNEVKLNFYIDGGSTPYTIELNWGDGSTETKVIDKPGNYTFTHQYRSPGNYAVKGRVRDVLGAITEISHAVVVAKPLDQTSKVAVVDIKPKNSLTAWAQRHWVPLTAGTTTVVVAVVAYLLGKSATTHAATSTAAAQSQARAPRKTVKPKPKGGKR